MQHVSAGLIHLLGVAAAFVGLCVGFTLLEALRSVPTKRLSLARHAFYQDALYFLITFALTRVISSGAVFVVCVPFLYVAGRHIGVGSFASEYLPAATIPHWIQIPLLIVGGDLIGYWVHRWFHTRALWRYHAIHHMPEDVTWATFARVHPINDMLIRISQGLPFILLGFSPSVVAPYVPVLVLYGIFQHADLPWDFGPLRGVLASPVFHRWHHTREGEGMNKNFAGLLPLWDKLFGTYYMPIGQIPADFGINGESPPESIGGQMVYPLRKEVRRP